MTRDPRRASVALAILVVTLLALVYMNGCASFRPEHKWSRIGPPSKSYVWLKVPHETLHDTCRITKAMHNLGACVSYNPEHSTVFSYFTEAQAKLVVSSDGEDLWSHEMRHVRGEIHQ